MSALPSTRYNTWIERFFGTVGQSVINSFEFIGSCTLLLIEAVKSLFRDKLEVRELMTQMSFVGTNSVPIVSLTTLSSGAVLALYSAEVLVRYGAETLAGATVAWTVSHEVAPVLAGIMVAARCGSAMAAQIGSMKVTEQIDALRSLNVSPFAFLVVPRVLACLTMVPLLALVGVYAGLFGGFIVAVYLANIPDAIYMDSVKQFLEEGDIWKGMLKALVFGLIVSLVACRQGMETREGAVGVGKATTSTVVITMVLIYVANYFLSAVLFKLGR